MRLLLASGSRRRPLAWIAAVLIVVLGVLTVASVVHRESGAELTGRAEPAPAGRYRADAPGTSPPDVGPAVRTPTLEPIPQTPEPSAFARAAAEALFEWDTASGLSLGDYRGRLLVVADPAGVESPGLVSDLSAYLPEAKVWEHLSRYSTRQWLQVTDVTVPGQWYEALAQVPGGTVADGTTALTVTGVRHRAGLWDGEPVTSTHDVAFTLFVVCGPTYPTCHLLRISQLDNPLK